VGWGLVRVGWGLVLMGVERMDVGRHLTRRQREVLDATGLAEAIVFKASALTGTDRDAAAKIR
jgi:hypothetical protein